MTFANPYWLLGIIPLFALIFYQAKQTLIPTIQFSETTIFNKIESKNTKIFAKASKLIRYLILFLLFITLARPQIINTEETNTSEGIDIMMIMDTSGSMAAEDLQPENRLEAAKETMKEFISKRIHDRIGLVVFGTDAYTQTPLTTDYTIISNIFDDIKLSMAGDGTSIGMAIATGLNRLKHSNTESKIIVLLTDGENNSGEIEPIRAAELARDLGIKIYSIGIGQEGGAPIPYQHPLFGKVYSKQLTYLDEVTLKSISQTTNGMYFRATDKTSLQDIYNQIDALEKTEIVSNIHIKAMELFPYFLIAVCFLLCLELLVFNYLVVVTP